METLRPPTFVVLKNVAAFVFGKMGAWGLTNKSMREDAWDYAHITTWNFLPFLLKRVGMAPAWVVEVLMALWLTFISCTGSDPTITASLYQITIYI
jgi:hypothetical protein